MRLAAILVLALSGTLGCEKLITYEPPAEKRTADIEKQSFEEAKGLAAKGDLDGAHAKLSQIKADSPLRTTSELVDMEDRWATARLDAAKKEADKTKKLAMLDEIARAPYVSAEIRARANDELEKANPAPAIPPPTGPGWDEKASEEALAKVRTLGMQRKFKDAEDVLMKRYTSGPVSPKEIETLSALCSQNKNQACLAMLVDAGAIPPALLNPTAAQGPGPTRR